MIKILKTLLFCAFLYSSLNAKDLNVVIIGGGPTGLATAIEAHQNGDNLVLIEKRDSYTRTQTLFLIESTLWQLDKWGVKTPEMQILEINKNRKMGVVTIQDLENSLLKRLQELDILVLQGEFKSFSDTEKSVVIAIHDKEITVPYDVLVAADGAHSTIREQLGIKTKNLGTAKGAIIYLAADNTEGKMDLSPTIEKNTLLLKRIKTPHTNIIMMQTPEHDAKTFSKEQLVTAAWFAGWSKDAKSIAEDKAEIVSNIDIVLQESESFSDEHKGVILVGDAVATAPYFHGTGLNSGFKTVLAAGALLKKLSDEDENSFSSYDKNIKVINEELINDSLPLWSENKAKKI
jgi:2-polyprenyl-6-methoxyphenol hydroxylase-like FAD-dependent oxidoreductase